MSNLELEFDKVNKVLQSERQMYNPLWLNTDIDKSYDEY